MNHERIGQSFEGLSQEEMDFVTGANGGTQPNATPTVTTSSAPCVAASKVISGGLVSFVVSFTASAWTKCRD
ncbi:lichenicidin A2 family type 2 lantibiotic [Actinomyces trachealis]|uniref:lichenicidin A2 family type 2 lantibiotic n=1 Tax=Actinomyces trachealis TaxID=2763540 RepID=UPI001892AA1C